MRKISQQAHVIFLLLNRTERENWTLIVLTKILCFYTCYHMSYFIANYYIKLIVFLWMSDLARFWKTQFAKIAATSLREKRPYKTQVSCVWRLYHQKIPKITLKKQQEGGPSCSKLGKDNPGFKQCKIWIQNVKAWNAIGCPRRF